MTSPLALDLFCGTGSATDPLRDMGWEVIGVDNDPESTAEHLCDIRTFMWKGRRPRLIWASPPCQEFTQQALRCYYPNPKPPSLELPIATRRLIEELRPRWWIVENVRGAVPFFNQIFGPLAFRARA